MISPKLRERQLTFGNYGHTLNHRQAISPDGLWAVYDTRNEDSQISRTGAIEMVHLGNGEIVRLYQTANQSEFGPGVGAASFHPKKPLVAFIHGLQNCTREKSYSAARRFGAIVDVNFPGKFFHTEARSVLSEGSVWTRPFGALSGGTHAHSWSPDGWLSFTYNDAWLERGSPQDSSMRNQRTVGFMVPGVMMLGNYPSSHPLFRVGDPVSDGADTADGRKVQCTVLPNGQVPGRQVPGRQVPGTLSASPGTLSASSEATLPFLVDRQQVPGTYLPFSGADPPFLVDILGEDAECFSGSFGAFLAASICTDARNGSDEIEAAVEECWVGRGNNALAFLGAARGKSGEQVNEIFVCDLPIANLWNETPARVGSLAAIEASDLLKPLAGCVQRRLTHTMNRTFPGVQGPRCWLVSSSDGKFLFAPMRDERGVAQLCRIDVRDGQIEQITDLEHPLAGQISVNPNGTHCSFICDQRICLVDVGSGRTQRLTEQSDHPLLGAIHFAGENRFVFNRYVGAERERWLQVFVGEMS